MIVIAWCIVSGFAVGFFFGPGRVGWMKSLLALASLMLFNYLLGFYS